MITGLGLGDFKSFHGSSQVDIEKINLVYGQNSSGKSSLSQALLLLKQTLAANRVLADDSALDFRGTLVDLGGFGAAVHEHNLDARIRLSIKIEMRGRPQRKSTMWDRRYFLFGGRSVTVTFGFDHDSETRKTRVAELSITWPDEEIRFENKVRSGSGDGLYLADANSARTAVQLWVRRDENEAGLEADNRRNSDPADLKWIQEWLRRTPTEVINLLPRWDLSELRAGRRGRPVGGSLDSPRRYLLREFVFEWQSWISDLNWLLATHITTGTHYIGPLRERPQRVSVDSSVISHDLGSRGERTLKVLSSDPTLLQALNHSLASLDVPYALEIQDLTSDSERHNVGEISILSLRDVRTNLLVTLSDVGVGISQVIPVLLQLLSHRNSLIVVEQPELHLHPRLQSRLADVVLTSVQEFNNRVILETHSEHLLIRLQRRIRAGLLKSSDLNVLYVSQDGPESTVSRLRLDKAGELVDHWPSGFFDERLNDILADDVVDSDTTDKAGSH